ncbi:MAG: family 4 glycosyl hydrolase [Planctomycetota bacterium]|jgi:alpha-galactosidase
MNNYNTPPKIAFIGGGSYHWTAGLAADMFLKEELEGSELVLVDINEEAAEHICQLCKMIVKKIGCGWKVRTASLEDALDGADYVCVSISTGGFEAMQKDYEIPEEFGIYHTVGDTVGPAGISRTLRNIPVFIDFAKKMERLCPEAWMIHVTNPLSQLTRAVCTETSIKCVGLCHNYTGAIALLADMFEVEYEDIDAVSVGVNHFTWLKNLTCKGKLVGSELSLQKYLEYKEKKSGDIITNTTDDDLRQLSGGSYHDYLAFELYEQFGFFPVGGCCHIAENFSFYTSDLEVMGRHRIGRKGVLPARKNLNGRRRKNTLDIIEGRKELGEVKASREYLADIVASLHSGKPSRVIAALPNKGQISNIAEDVVVETRAVVSLSGINPEASGEIPESISGFMQAVIAEEECTVQAAITGDRKLFEQALFLSPMVTNKDCVKELAEKLLAANKEWLPQFG